MSGTGRNSVTIIGGGASGVLLAAHLLRDPGTDIRVILIERRGQFGQGLAYSANQRDHRVNVPARGMSAFADDPEHFWRWLQGRNYPGAQSSWVFVPRRLYGTYLEHVLAEAGRSKQGRLVVLSERGQRPAQHGRGRGLLAAGLVAQVGERDHLAAPGHRHGQGRPRAVARQARVAGGLGAHGVAHVLGEDRGVEVRPGEAQPVAAVDADDDLGGGLGPGAADHDLQGLGRVGGHVAAPHGLDQVGLDDGATTGAREGGEQRLAALTGDGVPVVGDLVEQPQHRGQASRVIVAWPRCAGSRSPRRPRGPPRSRRR